MLRQLLSLYKRYTIAQLSLSGRPSAIIASNGSEIGNIDQVTMQQGRLRVKGWVHASRVTLTHDNMEARTIPRHRREDVAQVLDIPAEVGFEVDLAVNPYGLSKRNPPTLICDAIDERTSIRPVPLILRYVWAKRAMGAVRFSWAVTRLVPSIVGWYTTHDPVYRARVKAGLGLNKTVVAGELNTRLFATTDPAADQHPAPPPVRVTLVLPVYNAFDLLAPVLARVEDNTDLPWRLIMIEDGSSDDRVRPFLRNWVAQRQNSCEVVLIENPENQGFIRSVNTGLAQATTQSAPKHGVGEGPVILLNSDAFVPAGWASRLIRPLLIENEVASTTPMSNDAEIFSAPAICTRITLDATQGDRIDAVARRFDPDALLAPTPTGVGFCMAMSRRWLARVPALDTVFGRGYGEEVDWCQKVARMGGRHLAVPNLFVEHRGGESFGAAHKQALVARNNDIVSRRYPDYDLEVQSFIRSDPIVTPRLALGLAWAGSLDQTGGTPVYLAHSMGGGAETYLEGQIAEAMATDTPAVVLRVGGVARWQIELHTPNGVTRGGTNDSALMRGLIGLLSRRRIIYSCGVGDTDPATLPLELAALATGPEDEVEILFHDFFPLSPSYTLLESDGVFRGAPDASNDDKAHRSFNADGSPVTLRDWQAAWKALASKAKTLRVFSQDSAAHVRAVWPDLAQRIEVSPHQLPYVPRRLPAMSKHAPITIGVLGNIGFQKGAAVVQDLARLLSGDKTLRLVLIGNIDPSFALPKSVKVHGDYLQSDIPDLAARYQVTHWLIPSIWPETFSYTTREALATGRPVLAFDIGAQGEAVRAAANGIAVALPQDSRGIGLSRRAASGSAAQNLIEALKAHDSAGPETGDTEQAGKTVARAET